MSGARTRPTHHKLLRGLALEFGGDIPLLFHRLGGDIALLVQLFGDDIALLVHCRLIPHEDTDGSRPFIALEKIEAMPYCLLFVPERVR